LPSYALPLIAVGSPAVCVFEFGLCAILYPLLASQGSDLNHEADHDGDWCSVQLFLDARVATQSASTLPNQGILAIYSYAHGKKMGFSKVGFDFAAKHGGAVPVANPNPSGNYAIWEFDGPNSSNMDVDIGSDLYLAQNNAVQLAQDPASNLLVHPVVYIEWGGHEFWPTARWTLPLANKHGGDGYSFFATGARNIGEIAHPMDGDAGTLITSFAGYWGKYGGFMNVNGPPQGPPLHKQWQWQSDALLEFRPQDGGPY
jgi:hypothetical protein